MAFFAAFLPTLLKAIMGSGAVAIPAMTGAAGAAGAAGGTVGGAGAALPTAAAGPAVDPILAEGEPMAPTVGSTAGTMGANPSGSGMGGGAQSGGTSPQQISAGGKYGGTERDNSRPTAAQISGVPDDWLPYKVPKTGFGRFAQRLGGADPAARNAEFLMNKQKYGMEAAMDMEKQARESADRFGLQKDDQQFQQGQQQRRTQAERDAERDRRGFVVQQQNAQNVWTAKNQEYNRKMDTMEAQHGETGSYDPIVQNDFYTQRREAQLGALRRPVGMGAGMFYDPQYEQIGMIQDPVKPSVSLGQDGSIINNPGSPGGVRFVPRGGYGEEPQMMPPTQPPMGGGGGMPRVDPNNLQFMQPVGATNTAPAGPMDLISQTIRRIQGSRPFMYSSPR